MDEDFLLAVQLQEQFDGEYVSSSSSFPSSNFENNDFGHSSKKRKVDATDGRGNDVVPYWKPTAQPERPLSIVDQSWETLDPNPDVRAMFLEFNDMFFWSKLSGVEVKWSPRMTLCAGVCSYEGRGGLCSIRLSEPLLKLRPRKDLVETLLHEMIHALLFVTQNNRDRDGHGPEFCKHMNRINQATGTKITVYHSFHDEVDVYRQHWWKCSGPCQSRKPYFGFVKRAMNRAPSSLDPWWADHQRTCGGTYTKVKEPEGYGKKGKKDSKKEGKTASTEASGNVKPSTSSAGSGLQDIRNIIPFSGKGFLLGGKSQSSPPPVAVKTNSPPKKLPPPSSPLRPVVENTGTSIRPGGQKPPIKRSVSNTRVFANVNGSPVRIPKPHGSSSSQGAKKIRQKSIADLFESAGVRQSAGQSNTATSAKKSSTSTSSLVPVVQNKESQNKPLESKYFNHSSSAGSSGAAGGGQTSRKRSWDERAGSSGIFDLFRSRTAAASPAKESTKTKVPTVQQRTATAATATVTSSSSTSSSSTSSVSAAASSSSSSSSSMVSCPVCQVKVQESKINEHLDSCLS
ncbi:sprT-like domain-containing protein Spartan [Solea senegalensis]|uniref:DNA-dependent metalloprotease SPRTN n=1 Tax=Solea senegalensis TaxID=28829 RepID=A0AAV6RRY6_SOLSE|nr:DNA-dependent metalloprotease SPRTN [Solea senegalensis]KAG7508196.1 sprT-like domain-containing protein Spartan [Solea senegalensis]